MPNRILVLFAHPLYEKSKVHRSLVNHITDCVTFHDLYETYPEFNIDVEKEKQLLLNHDIIVWQHPIYWYSCPAILKQWIDMVLEVGWAYGPGGTALQGKLVMQVISTGGARATYKPEGFHHNTIHEFLAPFRRTAELCKMKYLPPFVAHGSHRATADDLIAFGQDYAHILDYFKTYDADFEEFEEFEYINDWFIEKGKI